MSRTSLTGGLSSGRGRGAFIIAGLLLAVGCGRSGERAPGGETRVAAADASTVADTLVVYKSATCGCCKQWIRHMEQNGFRVVAHDVGMAELNQRMTDAGVSGDLASCHTALVGGYVVEGHVPADLVKRMLKERPQITGLAVPAMPPGSPGMESGSKQPYDVIAFRRDGGREVYASR